MIQVSRRFMDPLRSITACLPVLSSNPVKCTKLGNLTATANSISVEAGDCRVESPILGVDPRSDYASALGVCTHSRPIGEATIVIGFVYQHADRLATAMGDSNLPSSSNSSGYVVSCNVDIQSSIAFRLVDYSFLTPRFFPVPIWLPDNSSTIYHSMTEGSNFGTGDNMGVASNGKECTPSTRYAPLELETLMSNDLLATGAAASWPLLSENAHFNGWWNTLWSKTQSYGIRDLPEQYTFDGSHNSLEWALGMASGIAMGAYWGSGESSSVFSIDLVNNSALIYSLRVGPGESWALVYIVPHLFAICLLIYLTYGPLQRR